MASSRDFACTLTAGIVRRVRAVAGERSLDDLLAAAGSTRSLAFLEDNENWVSFAEAVALFAAARAVTGDPLIARHVGEDAVRQYAGTQVATVLRSLGSPEEMLRQITIVAGKFSAVSDMEAVELASGRALVRRRARRHEYADASICEWAAGLLSAATMLYAVPAATVTEPQCEARGDDCCLMEITWDDAMAARVANPQEHITQLESQMVALNTRLQSMYAAAGDLIADDDLDSTLAKITERSASAVRAARYLLIVRSEPDAPLRIHHRGFADGEAEAMAAQVLATDPGEAPDTWLLADIRSPRNHYGRLLALFDHDQQFFPQEREALDHYARYAANALDRSLALTEARRANEETGALLDFARSLAGSDSSAEVARRLAEAVPLLVDCDRASVFLSREGTDRLFCMATYGFPPDLDAKMRELHIARSTSDPEMAEWLFGAGREGPLFFGPDTTSPFVQEMMNTFGSQAIVYVPIVSHDKVLGVLSAAVTSGPARLRESRELTNRLSGVVAQAAVGLENGELIDRISHQARHDELTGLANRSFFAERFRRALDGARDDKRPVGLFFVDLDNFKQVNDQYGHGAGDELLRQVATRLLSTVRALDTVARLGGDEFAIVLSQVTRASEIATAAVRVTHAFDDSFIVGEHAIQMRASVGRAVWPDDAPDLEQLMQRADAGMYLAKRSVRPVA